MKRAQAHQWHALPSRSSPPSPFCGHRNPSRRQPTFKSSVDLVRVTAVVRDQKGRFVQDLTARDFEVLDGGQDATDYGFPARPGGRQRGAAVRRERQHGSDSCASAREAATHVLSWLDATRTKPRCSRSTRGWSECAVHGRPQDAAGDDDDASCRSARRRCTTRSPKRPKRRRRARAAARGGRADRRQRQRQPADARAGVGDRQRDRRAGLHLRHRSVDRQPDVGHRRRLDGTRRRSAEHWQIWRRGPAATFSWRARRPSAASQRGRSSTSCGISI